MLTTATVSARRSSVVHVSGAEIEETVERDDEVAGVPAAHREGEQGEEALDVGEFAAVSDELEQHPERQQRADAIADDL